MLVLVESVPSTLYPASTQPSSFLQWRWEEGGSNPEGSLSAKKDLAWEVPVDVGVCVSSTHMLKAGLCLAACTLEKLGQGCVGKGMAVGQQRESAFSCWLVAPCSPGSGTVRAQVPGGFMLMAVRQKATESRDLVTRGAEAASRGGLKHSASALLPVACCLLVCVCFSSLPFPSQGACARSLTLFPSLAGYVLVALQFSCLLGVEMNPKEGWA